MKPVYALMFALLFGLTACNARFNSDPNKWVYFATEKNDKLFYTLDKIDKTDKGIIKIWVKTVFGTKLVVDNKEATYAKNMFMIDCTGNKYKMNVGYFFSATDEIVAKTTNEQPDVMPLILDKSNKEYTFKPISTVHEEYFPILPNSQVDKLRVVACTQKL
jgi:hypothetical protein